MTDAFYANTKKQPLDQHLFAVGYLAYRIIQQLVSNDPKLAKAVFIAGALHDLGKLDPAFQGWLAQALKKKSLPDVPEEGQHIDKAGKFSFEKHPRHNELSLLFFHLLHNEETVNLQNQDRIRHAIYWHHAKPIRKEAFKNLDTVYNKFKKNSTKNQLTSVFHAVKEIVKQVNALSANYLVNTSLQLTPPVSKPHDNQLYSLENTPLPAYKRYSSKENGEDYQSSIRENAKNNLARTAVISADRLISALSDEELTTHLDEKTLDTFLDKALIKERGLKSQLLECLAGFERNYPNSERNQQQSLVAKSLTDVEHVAVLQGAAGCGKTKIALEWAAITGAKQIIWVCPRVQVCQGLLSDLTSDGQQSDKYLPNTKIEILTGEFKSIHQFGNINETEEGQEFSGDIVLTTIDQIINTITTHRNVTGLIQYMNAHIVFDEYHEYINMPAFNLLFAELVECKKLQEEKAKALLISATPNYYFVETLLDIDRDDIKKLNSFNQSDYQINFTPFDETQLDNTNPLYQSQPENTFVISNTAITAQKSFIANQHTENGLLLHSKFKKSDRERLFHAVMSSFSQGSTTSYDVLRSGPVVQASLNISCAQMVTEFTHAENWLQRLGRLNRFGERSETSLYITAIPQTIIAGKQQGKIARFLNSLNSLQSAKAWYAFLQNSLSDKPVTLNEIYGLYHDFYELDSTSDAIEEDLVSALKQSVHLIHKQLLDPVSMPRRKKSADSKLKIKKTSLRGDNRFVQMAVCTIHHSDQLGFPNEYAYSESDTEARLTAPVEVICGYGDSKQNLLSFMAKKHHNIKGTKKSYKDPILLNEARNPETPVYLSYIPDDLKKVESQPHDHAIYYAVGYKQPIGAIAIHKLRDED